MNAPWYMVEAQIHPGKGAQFWNGNWNDWNAGFCDIWQEGIKFVTKEDSDKAILGRPIGMLNIGAYSAEHALTRFTPLPNYQLYSMEEAVKELIAMASRHECWECGGFLSSELDFVKIAEKVLGELKELQR